MSDLGDLSLSEIHSVLFTQDDVNRNNGFV